MFTQDRFDVDRQIKEIVKKQNNTGGKTLASIKAMVDSVQSIFAFIDSEHEIAPIPPFYREKKVTIQVLGTESLVWDWDDRDMIGECTHRNCRSSVRFFANKPLGHIFFFDIDEKPYKNVNDLIEELRLVIFTFGFSHFILTETTKGFHIWICEIRKQKIDFYSLFRTLQSMYVTDYEFHGQWILRLGNKQEKEPPKYVAMRTSEEIAEESSSHILSLVPQISMAHLTLLNKYAGMPKYVNHLLGKYFVNRPTFARQVLYHSFDTHGVKIDDTRF